MRIEIVYMCPFCIDNKGTPDMKGKLYVNTVKNVYHCFRCGASGKSKTLPPDMVELGRASFEDHARFGEVGRREAEVSGAVFAPLLLDTEGIMRDAVVRYLMGRGMTLLSIARHGVRYSTTANRVWFPVYGIPGGVPLWYLGHNVDGGYWMPPGKKLINHTVFRTFALPIVEERVDVVVVTEGIFDALSVGRILPAVATFGYQPPMSRLKAIPFLAKNAIVLYDPDATAEASAVTLKLLRAGVRAVQAEEHKMKNDPGASTTEELREVLCPKLVLLGGDCESQ